MADTSHTLQIKTTVQDLASGPLKKVGAEAQSVGRSVAQMDRSVATATGSFRNLERGNSSLQQGLSKTRAGLSAVTLATAALAGESGSAFGQFTRFASGVAGAFLAGGPILGGCGVPE